MLASTIPFQIPLRDRNKNIVAYTTVSGEDFELLNGFKWSKSTPGNYIRGSVEGKIWLLHRYITIVLMKESIQSGYVVDHINNNPLDNQRENLRIVSCSENSRNKQKRKGSSIFMGVSWNEKNQKWMTRITIKSTGKFHAFYLSEIHAAHQYNLWLEKYESKCNRNIIKEEDIVDFISWKPQKSRSPATNIQILPSGKYRVSHLTGGGSWNTLEEATTARDNLKMKILEIKENALLAQPIERNLDGVAIIWTSKKSKLDPVAVKVDDDDWYDLKRESWAIDSNGYPHGTVKGVLCKMHRFVMKAVPFSLVVDHIHGDRLDSRKKFLRLTTQQSNSHNTGKRKGQEYIGVNKKNGKYMARIRHNGKSHYLGTFCTEKEAALARDAKAIELGGHRLNYPKEIG